jgi:diguanylate cyclase (GGDEF)-like protein
MAYAYLLLAAAAVLLAMGVFPLRRYYRGEWALVLAAFGVPLVGNALYVFDVLPGPRLDYTNLGFVVSGLALTVGSVRGRLLEVMPVARGFVVDRMDDAMLLVNPRGKIVDCNPAARDLLRCPLAEAVGADAADAVEGWEQIEAASIGPSLVKVGEGAARRCYEVKVSSVSAVDGSAGRLVLFHDVTAREQLQAHLREWALSDPLTGLPNRRLFVERLDHALARAARTREFVAVLFCDLDDFKALNDAYGHDCGDEVLVSVAHRLTAGVRAADTVARLGGDEFGVLLEDISCPSEAEEIAQRLWQRLTVPVELAGRTVTTSASIGIAISQGDHSKRDLLRTADQAMYAAKSDAASRVVARNAHTAQE